MQPLVVLSDRAHEAGMREPGDLNTIAGWNAGQLVDTLQLVFEINDQVEHGRFSALRAGLRSGVEVSGLYDLGTIVRRARHVRP